MSEMYQILQVPVNIWQIYLSLSFLLTSFSIYCCITFYSHSSSFDFKKRRRLKNGSIHPSRLNVLPHHVFSLVPHILHGEVFAPVRIFNMREHTHEETDQANAKVAPSEIVRPCPLLFHPNFFEPPSHAIHPWRFKEV